MLPFLKRCFYNFLVLTVAGAGLPPFKGPTICCKIFEMRQLVPISTKINTSTTTITS